MKNKYISMTAHELLLALVPDFDDKLDNAPPELKKKILQLAVETEKGYRPLHYLRGCM